MSGYYPEGVTGMEYEVAGPDDEYTEERTVVCETEGCKLEKVWQDVAIDITRYREDEWGTWKCQSCNEEHEYRDYASGYWFDEPEFERD